MKNRIRAQKLQEQCKVAIKINCVDLIFNFWKVFHLNAKETGLPRDPGQTLGVTCNGIALGQRRQHPHRMCSVQVPERIFYICVIVSVGLAAIYLSENIYWNDSLFLVEFL